MERGYAARDLSKVETAVPYRPVALRPDPGGRPNLFSEIHLPPMTLATLSRSRGRPSIFPRFFEAKSVGSRPGRTRLTAKGCFHLGSVKQISSACVCYCP